MSELQSLFATFESLKSVEFPKHAVVRNSNSKHFIRHFKLHCSYSYIVVTLQLYILKNREFKKAEIIAFSKKSSRQV